MVINGACDTSLIASVADGSGSCTSRKGHTFAFVVFAVIGGSRASGVRKVAVSILDAGFACIGGLIADFARWAIGSNLAFNAGAGLADGGRARAGSICSAHAYVGGAGIGSASGETIGCGSALLAGIGSDIAESVHSVVEGPAICGFETSDAAGFASSNLAVGSGKCAGGISSTFAGI
jgi:hypothetical protein